MGNEARDGFSFEGFTLDLTRGCVRNANLEIELRPKSFELLCYLVTNAGRLITKDELVNAVWPNVIVSDDSLAQCVSDVRRALSDSGRRIIKTVPRRGYLFAPPVSVPPRHSAVGQPFVGPADLADREYNVESAPPFGPASYNQQGHSTTTRRLAAILAADVAGYSRLMGADEEGTLNRLKAHRRQLVDPKIKERHGRIVKTTGDGMLVEFSSVVDAVRCAVEIQRTMADRDADQSGDRRIKFRLGINLGDIIVDEDDIFGDGVNVAARLEALAEPGGIWISRVVRDQIRDKLPYFFEDLGEQSVKNIGRPVRVFAMSAAAVASLPPVEIRAEASKPGAPSLAPRLSIVVLPFANLSNDPEQEYFADGITDDLTSDLSRISGSFVIARHTAFAYKGKPVDVKQIGRELGVRYILEGSVRRTGDQVRVTVQLIDAETGAHVWADRFDVDRTNLAEAQDAITGRLARTLNCELVVDVGRRIEQESPVDPDARDLVMRGWAQFYRPRSIAGLQEAQRLFEQACEIDPGSVDARIGVARILVSRAANGLSASYEQDAARAEELLLRALELDTNSSVAHFSMGMLRRTQNRLSEARIELERAIALDRNDASAFLQLGQVLVYLGRPEAAIPHAEKAIRLSPLGPNTHVNDYLLGECHLLLGHVDEAIDLLTKAQAANPRLWYHHLWLAGALGLRGDLDEAKAVIAEAIKLKPEFNSLARARTARAGNAQFWALCEETLFVGLRRIGFPDQ